MNNNNNDLDKIVHQISYRSKERLAVFNSLDLKKRASVLLHLSKHIKFEILTKLKKEEVVNILECLDPDQATDILQLFPERRRMSIIKELSEQLRSDISLLLKFDSETAAGLMNVDYVQVEESDTIAVAAQKVMVHEKRTGKLPAILVVSQGELVGYLPVHKLGFAGPRDKVSKFVKTIKTVKYNTKTEEVIDIFRKYPHNKIVVLGSAGNVLGLIYSDDILNVLREKEASHLYDFAGLHDEESVYDSVRRKVGFRYKWLIVNLGTAFLAAFTVSLFDEMISKYVLLAIYMPIVAGMGGNAGTQTFAVLVRGIALKQIDFRTMWRTLKNELGSGFINGIITGLIVTAIVFFKDGNLTIGLILAAAMIFNLIIASLFGTIIPLLMKKLGKDPASSATIFITTATDVLGFLAFLGLASLILQ